MKILRFKGLTYNLNLFIHSDSEKSKLSDSLYKLAFQSDQVIYDASPPPLIDENHSVANFNKSTKMDKSRRKILTKQ